jgi:diguanylate cyclase (GGDEF)-like protein/PAS domain S-box-containing protein
MNTETEPLDILLVEDNPGDVWLIKEMLKTLPEPGCTLNCRERLSEAQRFLDTQHPEVILMDLGLPDAYGLDALEGIRNLVNGTAVVVLTAINDQRLAHRALQKGAQDYLVKGSFDAALLLRSMRYAIDRQRRESALKASEARIRKLLEACLIGIVLADPEGRIMEANPAFLDLMGLGQEELKGQEVRWDQLVTSADREKHAKALGEIQSGGGHPPWEVEFLHKDGRALPILLGAARLEGPGYGIVAYAMDISERRARMEELKLEARSDALTGLKNRKAFLELLEPAMTSSHRYGHPLSLALCDLDGFKQINDAHGHAVGDEVLRTFSAILAHELRGDDVAARFGGDEFCLLFAHSTAAQARGSLERIRDTFGRKEFQVRQGISCSATASFGLVELPPGVRVPEGLFLLADEALYRAKAGGRNRIEAG